MNEVECPVDSCEECEFHRTESWCAQAIPIREELDDIYKANMEGFWDGFESARKHYKWLEERYDETNDYIVALEKIIQNCYNERRGPTNEEADILTNYWR